MGHLAQVLSAADILPIFAVTAPVVPLYRVRGGAGGPGVGVMGPRRWGAGGDAALYPTQELSRLIPGAVVGELREDSSNVVQLITDAYEVGGGAQRGRGEEGL